MHIPVYFWNSYNLIYLVDNFRSIHPKTIESESDTTTSASVSDCEHEEVSLALPLDWFDVLSHSEPTSPFGSHSLFSDTLPFQNSDVCCRLSAKSTNMCPKMFTKYKFETIKIVIC